MGMGGLASALVSALHNYTAMPMVGVMVGCSTCGLIILAAGSITIKYRTKRQKIEEEPSIII